MFLAARVVDGVHADAEEVDEHQFDDRPHAGHRGADAGTDEGRLRDRGVADAPLPKLCEQARGRTEDAAIGGDILAHDEDRRIGAHFIGNALGNGV